MRDRSGGDHFFKNRLHEMNKQADAARKKQIADLELQIQQQALLIDKLNAENEIRRKRAERLEIEFQNFIIKNGEQAKITSELQSELPQYSANSRNSNNAELYKKIEQLADENQKLINALLILSNPFDELLLTFAKEGNLEKARAAILLGANVTACDSNGLSALELALLNGHVDIADLLIEKNSHLSFLESLLGIFNELCARGNTDAVKFILDKKFLTTSYLLNALKHITNNNVLALINDHLARNINIESKKMPNDHLENHEEAQKILINPNVEIQSRFQKSLRNRLSTENNRIDKPKGSVGEICRKLEVNCKR